MATVIGSFIKRRDFFHGFVSLPEGNIVAYEMYISVMAYDSRTPSRIEMMN